MDKRRNRKYSNNWNNQKKSDNQGTKHGEQKKSFQFNPAQYENAAAEKEKQKSIQEIKSREIICLKCGQPINDVSSAMNDKATGKPVHFECVLNEVSKGETLGQNEKIAYIGQGRFGILYFENPRDQRHFTIKKIIEWEERDVKPEWRSEISDLYSKVN